MTGGYPSSGPASVGSCVSGREQLAHRPPSLLLHRAGQRKPEDASDEEAGAVDRGGLLVPGGQAALLLAAIGAAFNGVALLVGLAVEAGRAPTTMVTDGSR